MPLPPTSNCATFDYGITGGSSASLGGSIVFFGGLQSSHTASYSNATGIRNGHTMNHSLTLSCGPANLSSSSTLFTNICGNTLYGLAVNTLPASVANKNSTLAPALSSASEPIWAKLTTSSANYGTTEVSPPAVAGAAAIFNPFLEQLLFFGGSTVLPSLGWMGSSYNRYMDFYFIFSSLDSTSFKFKYFWEYYYFL